VTKRAVFNSVDELAEYLGISRAKAYAMLREGKIPSIRHGKRFLVPIEAVNRWLESAFAVAA
jgi:excisionase family DNA binding protein